MKAQYNGLKTLKYSIFMKLLKAFIGFILTYFFFNFFVEKIQIKKKFKLKNIR